MPPKKSADGETNAPGDEHVKRRESINSSGYPLQLAVEQEVRKTEHAERGTLAWNVVGVEVPHDQGFLDLVVQHDYLLATIECKRETKQEWVFLVEDHGVDAGQSLNNINRCRWDYWKRDDHRPEYRIHTQEFWFSEGTYESSICIVSGKGRTKLLEPICQELIRATREIVNVQGVDRRADERIWLVPIIVTTTPLYVCIANPKDIDPNTGEVADHSTLKKVGCLRFRKTFLKMDETRVETRMQLNRLVRAQERTVLVCHSTHIQQLLVAIAKRHGTNESLK